MIVSHKNKFIFIATPKTGTTSVENTLGYLRERVDFSKRPRERQNPIIKHAKLSDIKRCSILPLGKYFSFSFSRNLWDRHVSIYFYYKKMIKKWGNGNAPDEWMNVYQRYVDIIGKSESFEEFVTKRPDFCELQTYWLNDGIDFIGKMENIQNDFDFICRKIKIPKMTLPTLNSTNRKAYTEYYNSKTEAIVAKAYKEDIEYLGYKFGE